MKKLKKLLISAFVGISVIVVVPCVQADNTDTLVDIVVLFKGFA
jgi:putative cell wall-binding protein